VQTPGPPCDLVALQAIVAGIEAVDVVPGRTEIIDEGQSFPVIVDSASTPEALSRHGNQSIH
jgi:UDP-N-acetylmuramyl tripeptide synthase